ncbi:hypothetical protein DMY89_22910 [Escherichia coli]|nr:hypothetical protein [Escherichia coli]
MHPVYPNLFLYGLKLKSVLFVVLFQMEFFIEILLLFLVALMELLLLNVFIYLYINRDFIH